jgi:hypothetical protein
MADSTHIFHQTKGRGEDLQGFGRLNFAEYPFQMFDAFDT